MNPAQPGGGADLDAGAVGQVDHGAQVRAAGQFAGLDDGQVADRDPDRIGFVGDALEFAFGQADHGVSVDGGDRGRDDIGGQDLLLHSLGGLQIEGPRHRMGHVGGLQRQHRIAVVECVANQGAVAYGHGILQSCGRSKKPHLSKSILAQSAS